MFICTGQQGKSNVRGALERNLNDKRECEFVMYLFVSDNLRVVFIQIQIIQKNYKCIYFII